VYPPAFRPHQAWLEKALLRLGRSQAALLNRILPGKRRAALLLVANERTRAALPEGLCMRIEVLGENGVELGLWTVDARQGEHDHAREQAHEEWHKPNGQTEARPETPSGSVTFAFVGRLVALKGVDLLLEAFALASRSGPMRLVIVGEGEERGRLQRQAAALFPAVSDGRLPSVRFTGWLTQAACARELAAAQCLVMPSLRDCGGAVVLEAMALSKPVIATAWGGALDYLDDSCGLLVEPRDRATLVSGLAEAMVRLAGSPLERDAMGHAGRRKVERQYDWDAKAGHIVAIYREVLRAALPLEAVATV
jgi:glycosyltransferase involved in cell wall biosynthesis